MHRLRDDVISQVFKPGEDLREVVLAKRYGVSRSPIRDALLQLTQEGLLVATPNCGVKVGNRLDEEMQPLVIDLRLRIEYFAAESLMKNLTPERLALLEERLKKNHVACQGNALPAIIKSDMEFHQTIIELLDNKTLLGVWKQVSASMLLHYERHVNWMDSYHEHQAIFLAIKANDKKASRAALAANIR